MIVCVDVDYGSDGGAVAAGVAFEQWTDPAPCEEAVVPIADVRPYTPGEFYRRELPCVLAVLRTMPTPEIVVVDGYVWLGSNRPGLGMKLYEELHGAVSIIGVAKTAFRQNDVAIPIRRGVSSRPLFVTAVGIDPTEASLAIASMHGPHRIPTLLARVDQLCRHGHSRA